MCGDITVVRGRAADRLIGLRAFTSQPGFKRASGLARTCRPDVHLSVLPDRVNGWSAATRLRPSKRVCTACTRPTAINSIEGLLRPLTSLPPR
jgi:hypothetical protein